MGIGPDEMTQTTYPRHHSCDDDDCDAKTVVTVATATTRSEGSMQSTSSSVVEQEVRSKLAAYSSPVVDSGPPPITSVTTTGVTAAAGGDGGPDKISLNGTVRSSSARRNEMKSENENDDQEEEEKLEGDMIKSFKKNLDSNSSAAASFTEHRRPPPPRSGRRLSFQDEQQQEMALDHPKGSDGSTCGVRSPTDQPRGGIASSFRVPGASSKYDSVKGEDNFIGITPNNSLSLSRSWSQPSTSSSREPIPPSSSTYFSLGVPGSDGSSTISINNTNKNHTTRSTDENGSSCLSMGTEASWTNNANPDAAASLLHHRWRRRVKNGPNLPPLGDMVEESLVTAQRVSSRLAPTVESVLSERGFTLHHLALPSTFMSSSDEEEGGVSMLYGREKELAILQKAFDYSCRVGTNDDPNNVGDEMMEPTMASSANTVGTSTSISLGTDDSLRAMQTVASPTWEGSDKFGTPLVLVSGPSGTGKSTLVRQLQKNVVSTKNRVQRGYFCMGKYDLHDRGIPFSGLQAAMKRLTTEILHASTEKKELDRIRKNAQINLIGVGDPTLGEIETGTSQPPIQQQDCEILMDLVPNLDILLQLRSDDTVSSLSRSSAGRSTDKTRLHLLFRRFIQAVCHPVHAPLILVLDDLHWADPASLEILYSLLNDGPAIPGLMVVGCFRSDEVGPDHRLTVWMESMAGNSEFDTADDTGGASTVFLKKEKSGTNVHLVQLEIDNLTELDLQKLLADVLHDPPLEKTQELATLFKKKTLGNAFYVLQFLKVLYEMKVLTFNIGSLQWQWNCDEIERGMDVTNNVAELMQRDMRHSLSRNATKVLQVGACLGNEFDQDLVELAVLKLGARNEGKQCRTMDASSCFMSNGEYENLSTHFELDVVDEDEMVEVIRASLIECVEQEFLYQKMASNRNIVGNDGSIGANTSFRFAHDQVQEAALSLIPKNELDLLRFYIGLVLIEELPPTLLDKNLFVAVDFVNKGASYFSQLDQTKQKEVIALNLRAGKKAMKTSAFEAAVEYLNIGIGMLDTNSCWKDPQLYQLSLDLYTAACQAEYCVGNMVGCLERIDVVKSEPLIPIQDKLRVYTILSEVHSIQEKHTHGLETTLSVLRELGVGLPTRMMDVATVISLMKTKALLRGFDFDSLTSLPTMKDRTKAMAMKLLDHAVNDCYMTNSKYLAIIIMKMVRQTIKHGVCEASAVAFGTYSVILVSLGEFKRGSEIARVADSFSKRPECTATRSRILMVIHGYTMLWTCPAKTRLKHLLIGLEIGMKKGDLENAFFSAYLYIMIANLVVGRPLRLVKADIQDFSQQMLVYNQNTTYKMTRPHLQFVLNMMGEIPDSNTSTILTGEIMEYGALMEHLEATKHSYLQDHVRTLQLYLAFYFDDLNLAWKMVKESKNCDQTNLAQPTVWRRHFFMGLTAYALARRANVRASSTARIKNQRHTYTANGRKSSYWIKQGNKATSKIKKFVSGGNVNCIHLYHMLEAERRAITGATSAKVLAAFDTAISTSSRAGFIHDRALAYERAADYLLHIGGEHHDKIHHYIDHAISSYKAWGASAKVAQLRAKYQKSSLTGNATLTTLEHPEISAMTFA